MAGRLAFVEDYGELIAQYMVHGVDLWLNLPRPPLEASGTSGMKIALNGGLNLSVLDGWWEEAWDGESGWAIESSDKGGPEVQDDHDATRLFDLVEKEVIPLFYDRDASGLPTGWLAKVKSSMIRYGPRFSADRMLREYAETWYAPARGGRGSD